MPLLDEFREIRRVGTPFCAIRTPDYRAVIQTLLKDEQERNKEIAPAVVWDCVSGPISPISMITGEPISARVDNFGSTDDAPFQIIANSVKLLPENGMFFVVLSNNDMLENPFVIQAIANLREAYKSSLRTLVLLGVDFKLPPLLADDIPLLDDPLPGIQDLAGIAGMVVDARNVNASKKIDLTEEEIDRAAGICLGMNRFAAEEGLSRKLRGRGMDFEGLRNLQRRVIEASSNYALKFETQPWTFRDMGGAGAFTEFMRGIAKGPRKFRLVVRVDEIDKFITAASTGTVADNTGVSQDLLRAFLLAIEDNDHLALLSVGPPGCLRGDTPVYDPFDRTTKTVRERYQDSKPFHVVSLENGDGKPVIAMACAPYQYETSEMVEVTLDNGRSIVVTPAHKVWDGERYVSVSEISSQLLKSDAYHLPSISEPALEALRQGALHWRQTVQDSQENCLAYSCFCDAQLQRAVNTDQVGALLQGDVPQHIHAPSLEDGQARRHTNNPLTKSVLLSTQDCTSLAEPHLEGEDAPPLPEEQPEHDPGCFSADARPHQQAFQAHIKQLPVSCESVSKTLLIPSPLQSPSYCTRGSDFGMVLTKIVAVKSVPPESYYDFHVPKHNNYMAAGIFHHNTGKTLSSIATGNEYGARTMTFDMGAVKGSLVGESEARMRRIIQIILAMAGRDVLWIATANRTDTLPPELQARFWLGTWFWDLPTTEEKALIWKIQRERHGINPKDKTPADENWVGRDIRNCLTPDSRLLREDLRWIQAGDCKPGDSILGFDEDGPRRKYRTAVIEHVSFEDRPVFRVQLQGGHKFFATGDHRVLALQKQGGDKLNWKEVSNLTARDLIPRLFDPWDECMSKEAGWLAGIFDGEGHLELCGKDKGSPGLVVAQNPGLICDRIELLLRQFGANFTRSDNAPFAPSHWKRCQRFRVTGGLQGILPLLGAIRPERLISKISFNGLGRMEVVDWLRVKYVHLVGTRQIVKIQTSTGTLIADGLPHHNCCRMSAMRASTLQDAVQWITVSGLVNRSEIEKSRDQAQLKAYRSAATPGAYVRPENKAAAKTRKFAQN